MDVLSHGLWGALLAQTINQQLRKKKKAFSSLDGHEAFLWGVLPDLIPFTPLFVLVVISYLIGQPFPFRPAQTETLEALGRPLPVILGLAQNVYAYTHSYIIFGLVFLLVWAGRSWFTSRRFFAAETMPAAMFAWALHITMDIPTHSTRFYATPFLWPLSNSRIDGIPWSHPLIFGANMAGLVVVYWWTSHRVKKADA